LYRIIYYEPQEEVSITFDDYSPEVGDTALIQACALNGPVPSRSNPLEYTSLELLAKRALPTPREKVADATRSTARRVMRGIAGSYDKRELPEERLVREKLMARKTRAFPRKIQQSASVKRAGEKVSAKRGGRKVSRKIIVRKDDSTSRRKQPKKASSKKRNYPSRKSTTTSKKQTTSKARLLEFSRQIEIQTGRSEAGNRAKVGNKDRGGIWGGPRGPRGGFGRGM
jgi:hypothetical protein